MKKVIEKDNGVIIQSWDLEEVFYARRLGLSIFNSKFRNTFNRQNPGGIGWLRVTPLR
jgi:hypothetical protein